VTRSRTGIPAAFLLAGGLRASASTPDVDDQISEVRKRFRLDLVLFRTADRRTGSYEWQDGHGKVVCCGSARGSIYNTKCAAVRALLEAM
jgi:hypothetical protein